MNHGLESVNPIRVRALKETRKRSRDQLPKQLTQVTEICARLSSFFCDAEVERDCAKVLKKLEGYLIGIQQKNQSLTPEQTASLKKARNLFINWRLQASANPHLASDTVHAVNNAFSKLIY